MSEKIKNNFDENKIPIGLEIRDGILLVTLKDGRLIGTPIEWYPKLAYASSEQLADYELWAFGIHWEALDEDIGIEGMLLGIRPKSHQLHQK
jgi:Protein of unknown function (DUF2442)